MRRLMLLATLLLVAACQPAATPLPDDAAPSPTPGVATSQLPTTEPIPYDGPRDFDPGFPQLVDVLAGGDFEAMTTWYIGLNDEACVRAFALSDPDRLVIDLEH